MKTKIKLDGHGNPRFTAPDGTTYVGRPDTVASILRRTDPWYRHACEDGTASTSMLGMEYAHRLVEAGTDTSNGVISASGFGVIAPALVGTDVPGGHRYEMPNGAYSADIVCGLHALAESPTLPADARAGVLTTEITVFERAIPLGAVLRRHH